jgi:hypothetical protein
VASGVTEKPVLVTGMHRGGTSWLGHMLCAGGDFIEIHEPLNVLNRQTILDSRAKLWYTYITDGNEERYLRFYRDAFRFRPHPILDVKRMRIGSPRDPVRIPKRWASFLLGRLGERRPLIRDPFAVFSLDWFVRCLDCTVVVSVRHPGAVVSSLKRLGYTFDFNNLLQQPLLMTEQLQRFRPEMEAMLASPGDVVGQGALLWRMIYASVSEYSKVGHEVRVVRHEDLSLDPLHEYARLYAMLGLQFTVKAQRKIIKFTSAENPKEVSVANPFKLRIDSRANLENWKRRLQREEIHRIRTLTEDVAGRYYSDDEWIP